MSFSLTTDQIRNRTKTVTRRVGWDHLRPGDVVWACVKCQGLKKGEKVERICQIRIVSNTAAKVCEIDQADVAKEGFPELSPEQFVEMFCKHMKVWPTFKANRIEFEYIDCALCHRKFGNRNSDRRVRSLAGEICEECDDGIVRQKKWPSELAEAFSAINRDEPIAQPIIEQLERKRHKAVVRANK